MGQRRYALSINNSAFFEGEISGLEKGEKLGLEKGEKLGMLKSARALRDSGMPWNRSSGSSASPRTT